MSQPPPESFDTIDEIAEHLRKTLDKTEKSTKFISIFAYNGTGKTRISKAFKDMGVTIATEGRDTLYYNAFTEDLFNWQNDMDNDSYLLKIDSRTRFFNWKKPIEMESRINEFLHRHVNFDFKIDYEKRTVAFSRQIKNDTTDEDAAKTKTINNIKISRGEESLFIWCFFLALLKLSIDRDDAYGWVKYVYIDDPISSLDDNNAIAIGHHLAQLIRQETTVKFVLSSHHALFFNVIYNELNSRKRGKEFAPYFLSYSNKSQKYILNDTGDTPFFQHVVTLIDLQKAVESGELYTYHFNILRTILEKTASFHGFKKFSDVISTGEDDPDEELHARIINILNHGNYSHYEPREMQEDNKIIFEKILNKLLENYSFNLELFPQDSS